MPIKRASPKAKSGTFLASHGVAIRLAALWLVCSLCCGADLESLRREHRWFDLREALKGQRGSTLDRGAAAAAFQQVREAERLLKTSRDNASRDVLCAMFVRNGRYQKARAVLKANQTMAEDGEGIRTLAQLADQSLVSREFSRIRGEIRWKLLFAPVSVNGHNAKAMLDTGSDTSVVSESEASRLGLKIAGAATLTGLFEEKASARVGTAEHFEIGGLRLRNVAFWILSDEQAPFKNLPPGERVILGLPVLLAMGGLRWGHDGTIEIGARIVGRDPNLCFDKMDLIVKVESQGKNLEMLFDTGSTETNLLPRVLRDFPEMALAAKRASNTMRGVMGSTEVESEELEEIALRLHGTEVIVRPARILMKSPLESGYRLDGWLGFDSLERGGAVDFRAMIATIE
jgi:hypothetical protein